MNMLSDNVAGRSDDEAKKAGNQMQRRITAAIGGAAALAAAVLALSGCATSGGSSGGSTSGGTSPLTYMDMTTQTCSVPPDWPA